MSREYRKRYDPSFGFVTLALANAMRGGRKKKKEKEKEKLLKAEKNRAITMD